MSTSSLTVAVFSNKGGSGKTTIAVHLALAWAKGARMALLDVDPQGTASEWLKRRSAELKGLLTVPSSAQIAWLMREADLIVVPTRATAGHRGGSGHHQADFGPRARRQATGRLRPECVSAPACGGDGNRTHPGRLLTPRHYRFWRSNRVVARTARRAGRPQAGQESVAGLRRSMNHAIDHLNDTLR